MEYVNVKKFGNVSKNNIKQISFKSYGYFRSYGRLNFELWWPPAGAYVNFSAKKIFYLKIFICSFTWYFSFYHKKWYFFVQCLERSGGKNNNNNKNNNKNKEKTIQ